MFGKIMETFQLMAAAAKAQQILEMQMANGLFSIDPKTLSSRIVIQTFHDDRAIFNGRKGPKPHKITMAAMAFGYGMRSHDRHSDEYMICMLSLGAILMEMETRGGNYSLNGKDHAFLDFSAKEYQTYQPLF